MIRHLPHLRCLVALPFAIWASACASTGGVPRPFPTPGAPEVKAPIRSSSGALDDYALVGTALALRGVPYRDGGADPQGFDCSGFTQYVYALHGVTLPRAVRDQFALGRSVKTDNLAAGDLLFFTTIAPGPTHVAIAIGSDQFVHAPSSTGVVRVERLSANYWASRYLGARRIE